jgi:hypothetical protein
VGDGIRANGAFGHITMDLDTVRVSDNGGYGISGAADNTYFTLTANALTANGNTLDNVNLDLSNSTMLVGIQNSTFNNSLLGSGLSFTNAAGGGSIALDTVLANGNAQNGLLVAATTFAQVDVNVNASLFNGNGGSGVFLFTATGGQINYVNNIQATGNGLDGFHFEALSDGVINATLNNDNLTANSRSAVYGVLDNGTADITLTRVRGSNSGADGMYLQATNQSVLTVTADRSDFSNSGQLVDPAAAIRIIADNSDVAVQAISTPLNNSVIGGPQDDGLNVVADHNSVVLVNLASSDMSGNADNAMDLITNHLSQVTVNLDGSSGNDSGNDGILFQALNGGSLTVTTVTPTGAASNFDRSGMNGINGYLDNQGVANFNFLNSSLSFSGDNGMVIVADHDSSFTALFDGGSFVKPPSSITRRACSTPIRTGTCQIIRSTRSICRFRPARSLR